MEEYILTFVGRESIVGVATDYGADGLGIESRWEARFFAPIQISSDAHPAPAAIGTGFLSQG